MSNMSTASSIGPVAAHTVRELLEKRLNEDSPAPPAPAVAGGRQFSVPTATANAYAQRDRREALWALAALVMLTEADTIVLTAKDAAYLTTQDELEEEFLEEVEDAADELADFAASPLPFDISGLDLD